MSSTNSPIRSVSLKALTLLLFRILVSLHYVILCKVEDEVKNHGDRWTTGGFTYVCTINPDTSWIASIDGCVWPLAGITLQVGEETTHRNRTAQCYQVGNVTKFQEAYSGGFKTHPVPRHIGAVSQRTDQCHFKGDTYLDGERWTDGPFQYYCDTGDFGWKADIIGCIFIYPDGTEEFLNVDTAYDIPGKTISCKRDDDLVLYKEDRAGARFDERSGHGMPYASGHNTKYISFEGRNDDRAGQCHHFDADDARTSYEHGAVWLAGQFYYTCIVNDDGWVIEVVACYWNRLDERLEIGTEKDNGRYRVTCTPGAEPGTVDFAEQQIL